MTDTSKEAPTITALRQLVNLQRLEIDEVKAERDAEKARADGLLAEAEERECLQAEQDKFAAAANEQIADLQSQLTAANEKLASARKVIERQANDDGLWFLSRTAPEAYLQAALRNLHAAVEGTDALGNATHPTTPAGHEGQCDHSWHLYQPNGFSAVKERCGKCWEIRSIAEALIAKESQS